MIIVASVRPGRIGLPIARWVEEAATAHGGFDIDFVELAELALPFMDEPNHPRLHNYTKQHTIDWSARVEAADAFVFVTPEYNHSFAPALKNALDFLNAEWWRKPVAFVSYGGASSGTRGVVGIEPAVIGLGMVRTGANVEIPFAMALVDDGGFHPSDKETAIIEKVLAELTTLAEGLKPLR